MKGKGLPITGTGEETRDFTFVGDIVDGLLRMAHHENSTGEAYNLATQHERQILYLAELINELTGNPAGIEFKERRKWDSKPRLCASNEKARNQLGCKFDLNFPKGTKPSSPLINSSLFANSDLGSKMTTGLSSFIALLSKP